MTTPLHTGGKYSTLSASMSKDHKDSRHLASITLGDVIQHKATHQGLKALISIAHDKTVQDALDLMSKNNILSVPVTITIVCVLALLPVLVLATLL